MNKLALVGMGSSGTNSSVMGSSGTNSGVDEESTQKWIAQSDNLILSELMRPQRVLDSVTNLWHRLGDTFAPIETITSVVMIPPDVWVDVHAPALVLGRTLARLQSVLQVEEDEENDVRPSDYAVETTLNLLYAAQEELEGSPLPSVGADYKGGLHITWGQNNKAMHLMVPPVPGGNTFIYYSDGDKYDIQRQVSGDTLVAQLRWLVNA